MFESHPLLLTISLSLYYQRVIQTVPLPIANNLFLTLP